MAFDLRVRLGDVVRLTAQDRFRPTDGPVSIWVTGVRLVTNRPEGHEWIWLEGVKMMHDGRSGDHALVLVRASMFAADGGQS
ncbi:hypothetical protein O7623_13200 [Solwaraspora sp. WMMD791]|uniref:hypothetical protein n=1 Tax=Solwaraspora sp. WMMD791 TaxID=3016086 RepID=UPI00249BDD7D|nr:hypothetical protein [Solwaraspora sp. WMMD791]WFE30076.1 hypothetical protein O7623_13200 [Solwaraspora sp. WMMD791]